MCSPNLRSRMNPAVAERAATPSPNSLGIKLAAFSGTVPPIPQATSLVGAATSPPVKPLLHTATPMAPSARETLPSLVSEPKIETRQIKSRPARPVATQPPINARLRGSRSRNTNLNDTLAGSRYDGLRGKALDLALEESRRRQQAIDAAAEWRATLGRITRDYQVPDDPDGMVYVPNGIWAPLDLRRVTAKERRLILQLPIRAGLSGWNQFNAVRKRAVDMTGTFIGLPTPNQVPRRVRDYIERTHPGEVETWIDLWRNTDGHSDAFRHAYWNALMTKAFGPVFAQAYGSAHEGGPNSPQVSEAMDLYNNEVGRTIAEDYPDASEQQLAILVRNALRSGKLVLIDQDGRLAWSNKVKWAEHGLAPPAPGSIKGGKVMPMAGETYHP